MPDFDAVIVGAGAGGGIAAYVLATRGWKVALLEKGRNSYPTLGAPVLQGNLFGNDEIRLHRYYGYQDPFVEPRTFRPGAGATQATIDFQGLGVTVGGGTVQYDADSPRLQRIDFRSRSTFGPVDGADVVDWPISYDDVAPFYDATEALIGVQGDATSDPFAEPRGPYPMPPGYPPKGAMLLVAAAQRLGYHPHPMPMAVNSIFYRGRPACTNCGFCHYGCPANAKGSTAVTAIREALLTGNLTILSESCATEVLTTPSGESATGVRYIDPKGQTQVVSGKHVVVAANAIETPRLLLASSSSAHPDGVGNSSGLVGRYLMFHVYFPVVGVFAEEIRSYRGRVDTHAISDLAQKDAAIDGVRGGYVELGGQLQPLDEGLEYPWLVGRQMMVDGRYRRRIVAASMCGEDVPQAANRVDLDPKVHDVYGRPAARVTYSRHSHDQSVIDLFQPKLIEILREAGAVETLPTDPAKDGPPDTKHLMGTMRMGTDPTTSVTDSRGRLHDVENVWIADGSLWPSSAAFNPTLTQQALAWRTAAYLVNPTEVKP